MENRGFEALEATLKCENQMKYKKVLFIKKHQCAAKSGVRSIAGGAIDRSPACFRSYDVRSVTAPCQLHVHSIVGVAFDLTVFDCTRCDQSQIIASEFPQCK